MAVDTTMHRRAKLNWGAASPYPNGGSTVYPAARRRVPGWVWFVLGIVIVGVGVAAILNQRSSATVSDVAANDWPATVEPLPEAQRVIVADSAAAENGPPVGVVMNAEFDGRRFVWVAQSGACWYADNVGGDGAPIAGVFYLGDESCKN